MCAIRKVHYMQVIPNIVQPVCIKPYVYSEFNALENGFKPKTASQHGLSALQKLGRNIYQHNSSRKECISALQ